MTDASTLRKTIHVGCKQLGLDTDTRHDLQLVATGKASLTEMTEAELQAVIDALKARGFRPDADPRRGGKGRPAAKRADVRYCHVLWRLLAEGGVVKVPGPKGLNAFIRSRFGEAWGHVPIDIDAMSDWQRISDVIRALKAMCRRAGIPVTKGPGQ